MKSHFGRRQRARVLASAMLLWLGGSALSVARAAEAAAFQQDETVAPGASGADTMDAPATVFTINAVLAKLDRERGRGPNAVRLAALAAASATDALPEPSPSADLAAAGQEPFGLFTVRAPESLIWQKWRVLEREIGRDQAVLARCREGAAHCPPNAAQFLRLIGAVAAKSGRAQLEEVNAGVNAAIRYVSDIVQHHEPDRWSAPLASFATGKGDCEDYAIAKYVALREAGFPEAEMRLLLVRDRTARQDHAVLSARLDGRWLILDNRWSSLRADDGALNFTPLFALNHDGVHLFAKAYAKPAPVANSDMPAIAAGDLRRQLAGGTSSETALAFNSLPLLL